MLKAVLSAVILIIAVILYTVYLFLKKNFNGLSWEEIVFHLKVPMKGTSNEMILDYFRTYGIRMGIGVCLSVLIRITADNTALSMFGHLTSKSFNTKSFRLPVQRFLWRQWFFCWWR